MEIRNMIGNGVSVSEISRLLGVDRKTVRKYTDQNIYSPYFRQKKQQHKLDPYKDYIRGRLEKYPLSSIRLYDEILKMGYTGKITRLRDFLRELHHDKTYHAVMMFETTPGQQGQIDWGYFGKMQTEEGEQEIYGFCMILGYSRTRYVEFTNSMKLETLLRCHINAYKYFGGAPNEHLYDNMKQVVIVRRRTTEDSTLNLQFVDFASYYGINPKLCRPYKPRTKGKVEKLVDYTKGNFFLGLEFTDLEDLNMKARAWMDRVNSQPHSTTKEAPLERLKKEQPFLIKTAGKPDYKISEVLYRRARTNCLVSVYCSEYSVPPKYANREVEVRVEEEQVVIFYRGNEIASHRRLHERKVSFLDAHRAELEQNCFHMPRVNKARRTAEQVDVTDQAVEKRSLLSYEVE